MYASKQILFFISALGAFNGIILSCYFFFFTKKKSLSNVFLGLLLLALSIRIGKSVFLFFDSNTPKVLLQMGLSACFFIGPSLYFFLKSSVEQTKEMPFNWKIILGFHGAIALIVGSLFPYSSYIGLWKSYFVVVIYCQWFGFMLLSAWILKPLILKQEPLKAFDKWLFTVYFCNLLIFIGYILGMYNAFQGSYITGSVTFSLVLYVIIFTLLHRKKTDDLFGYEPLKYNSKKIEDNEANVLIQKLENLFQQQEAYKNPDLKLNDLAKKMNISGHQLSQLLNDNLGKSFPNYINEYRIKKACELMLYDDRLKLEAVGYEVGFNSKSTFFAAFKKIKGTTPLLFKEGLVKN